jgi:hypothetical protein
VQPQLAWPQVGAGGQDGDVADVGSRGSVYGRGR